MKIEESKTALQTLIIRLQDAEKGFREIAKASSKNEIMKMAHAYADERHYMHRVLEKFHEDLGGDPEVKTSMFSSVHRMWIDIKVNGWGDNFTSVVDEIERGSVVLLDEYQIILDNTDLSSKLRMILTQQQEQINLELNELRKYREEIQSIEA